MTQIYGNAIFGYSRLFFRRISLYELGLISFVGILFLLTSIPVYISLRISMQRRLAQSIMLLQSFIIARDQAYFKTVFFSGDRPGDLGQVKVAEILRFPKDDGFLFNHIWGKTLREGDQNVFGI